MDKVMSPNSSSFRDLDWKINLLPLMELLISQDELEYLNRGIDADVQLE